MKFLTVNEQQHLYLSETQQPTYTDRQCLVRVKAIGVNRADILQKQGLYPPPPGESTILGLEMSGEIVAVGAQCKTWTVGQKVFGLVAGGAYAEYVAIEAEHIMPLPEAYSFVQGAAIAETFLTAYQSLFYIAELVAQQSVLIHAGASGVGSSAIQLAKAINCRVVVTVSSDEKGQACLALGADEYINYQQQSFVAWAEQYQPTGFDVILDVVGADYLAKNIDVAAIDGSIIMLALLGGRYAPQVDVAKILMKRISIHGSTLRSRNDSYKTNLIQLFSEKFLFLFSQGQLNPLIDNVYSWQIAEQAHQRMSANLNIGKLILTIE